jgi:hypothetical protein
MGSPFRRFRVQALAPQLGGKFEVYENTRHRLPRLNLYTLQETECTGISLPRQIRKTFVRHGGLAAKAHRGAQ